MDQRQQRYLPLALPYLSFGTASLRCVDLVVRCVVDPRERLARRMGRARAALGHPGAWQAMPRSMVGLQLSHPTTRRPSTVVSVNPWFPRLPYIPITKVYTTDIGQSTNKEQEGVIRHTCEPVHLQRNIRKNYRKNTD